MPLDTQANQTFGTGGGALPRRPLGGATPFSSMLDAPPPAQRGAGLTPPHISGQLMADGLANKGPSLAEQYRQLYPTGTAAAQGAGAPAVTSGPPPAKPTASPEAAGAQQSMAPGSFNGNMTHGSPAEFKPGGSPHGGVPGGDGPMKAPTPSVTNTPHGGGPWLAPPPNAKIPGAQGALPPRQMHPGAASQQDATRLPPPPAPPPGAAPPPAAAAPTAPAPSVSPTAPGFADALAAQPQPQPQPEPHPQPVIMDGPLAGLRPGIAHGMQGAFPQGPAAPPPAPAPAPGEAPPVRTPMQPGPGNAVMPPITQGAPPAAPGTGPADAALAKLADALAAGQEAGGGIEPVTAPAGEGGSEGQESTSPRTGSRVWLLPDGTPFTGTPVRLADGSWYAAERPGAAVWKAMGEEGRAQWRAQNLLSPARRRDRGSGNGSRDEARDGDSDGGGLKDPGMGVGDVADTVSDTFGIDNPFEDEEEDDDGKQEANVNPITSTGFSGNFAEKPTGPGEFNQTGFINNNGKWVNWTDATWDSRTGPDLAAFIQYANISGKGFWRDVVGIDAANLDKFAGLPNPTDYKGPKLSYSGLVPDASYLDAYDANGNPNPNFIRDPGIRQVVTQGWVIANKLNALADADPADPQLAKTKAKLFDDLNLLRLTLSRYGISFAPRPAGGFGGLHQLDEFELDRASGINGLIGQDLTRALHLGKDSGFKDYAAALEFQREINESDAAARNRQQGMDQLAKVPGMLTDDPNRIAAQGIADQLGDYNLTDSEYQQLKNRRAASSASDLEGQTRQLSQLLASRGMDPLAGAGIQTQLGIGANASLADALGQMDVDRAGERRNNQLTNLDVRRKLSTQYTGADTAARMALANYFSNASTGARSPFEGLGDAAANSYAAALAQGEAGRDQDTNGTQLAASGAAALLPLLALAL